MRCCLGARMTTKGVLQQCEGPSLAFMSLHANTSKNFGNCSGAEDSATMSSNNINLTLV
jgi:hypothetical protein